jgi:hypothetical protein
MQNAKDKTGLDSVVVFTKRLRDRIRSGEITCSVRIWQSPRVRVGARYPMDEGTIEIESIEPIGFPDITPELARESGFNGVIDLLKVAKHGKGEYVYLIRFHYLPPGSGRPSRKRTSRREWANTKKRSNGEFS